jgi:Uma2 family endonuclease
MLIDEQLMTIETFEEFIKQPDKDGLWELIDGVAYEKMPTEEHGVVVLTTAFEIKSHAKEKKIGRIGVEIRNRIPSDRYNSRIPDISFFLDTTRPAVTEGAVPQMPDLAVEVKSPDDTYVKMRAKAEYYLANGAKMVWLIYPNKRAVEVLTLDDFVYLREDEILTGGDVLPDFRVLVADLFKLEHE